MKSVMIRIITDDKTAQAIKDARAIGYWTHTHLLENAEGVDDILIMDVVP